MTVYARYLSPKAEVETIKMNKEQKNALNWLRVIACIGIILMHVRFNMAYEAPSNLFNIVIDSFTDFVFLFMAVSSFGLCCGYYQRFVDGSINWDNFYKRRFAKILPFFITMILLDLCMGFSFDSLMQALVEATLFHGFIPIEFNVIGVGWFLGLIFIFYLSFPFFCVLLKNKKTGCIAFIIALGLSLICTYYFKLSRSCFAVTFCFFLTGGLIYLYKDSIEKMRWWYLLIIMILFIALYYLNTNIITQVLVTASILTFAVSLNIRPLKPVTFFSSISMEIYLCHMVIYRALEKLHIFDAFGGGLVQYLLTCIAVFIGASALSVVINFILDKLFGFIQKRSVF